MSGKCALGTNSYPCTRVLLQQEEEEEMPLDVLCGAQEFAIIPANTWNDSRINLGREKEESLSFKRIIKTQEISLTVKIVQLPHRENKMYINSNPSGVDWSVSTLQDKRLCI